eukprot:IDg11916t1
MLEYEKAKGAGVVVSIDLKDPGDRDFLSNGSSWKSNSDQKSAIQHRLALAEERLLI